MNNLLIGQPSIQSLEGTCTLSCHFGATVGGDVFQCKLDECFGHIPNVIVIADGIMVVGKQPNHKDHDQALTTLLETARHCSLQLNYEKLQYK